MTTLLLQRILGSGPSVKYGAGSGVLSAAAASVGGNVAASGVCQVNMRTLIAIFSQYNHVIDDHDSDNL